MEENEKQEVPETESDGPVEAGSDSDINEQLEEALREKDQFRAIAQRAQADLVNYRRRASEELGETRRSATSHLLLKVISVVDDLERALAMIPDEAVVSGWLEGLRLVERKLQSVLESEGVAKIEAEGLPFEPREHEAVLYQESLDSAEGTVLQVIREGYKLHERVLRAAQVTVSKAPEQSDGTETTEQES